MSSTSFDIGTWHRIAGLLRTLSNADPSPPSTAPPDPARDVSVHAEDGLARRLRGPRRCSVRDDAPHRDEPRRSGDRRKPIGRSGSQRCSDDVDRRGSRPDQTASRRAEDRDALRSSDMARPPADRSDDPGRRSSRDPVRGTLLAMLRDPRSSSRREFVGRDPDRRGDHRDRGPDGRSERTTALGRSQLSTGVAGGGSPVARRRGSPVRPGGSRSPIEGRDVS